MNKENKLYFESIYINLNSIDFKRIEDAKEVVEGFKIVVKDSYDIVGYSNENFNIQFSRKVELEPKSSFEIIVKFDLLFNLGSKTIKKYQNDVDGLHEVIKEKTEKAIQLSNVISRASALISSISMQLNCNPIITPPVLQK